MLFRLSLTSFVGPGFEFIAHRGRNFEGLQPLLGAFHGTLGAALEESFSQDAGGSMSSTLDKDLSF